MQDDVLFISRIAFFQCLLSLFALAFFFLFNLTRSLYFICIFVLLSVISVSAFIEDVAYCTWRMCKAKGRHQCVIWMKKSVVR